ncbi:MAG: Cytidylate kinase [Chloroflexi bacterium AL-W]|nr:Cytidylate kinase [Chloroflexi bacterium AL-N1]NOK68849.1 Cytidylate kinase [Chloroflexi bacterium AL-N10]NOK76833.1 Cytidylate kinase [Chloroflexi bacterium AL-N5]NOK82780.1 Cytidylate kinase [Chloroflexi bacterium AL-W]NOK90690.1 Cytidylate kinase [Chloroflexi bacterium AL-N15]
MEVIETIAAFRQVRAQYGQLGFVPTMGYLHEGHLSLARLARDTCGSVAASIFVNPTQFGPTEDFARYPRSFERDLDLLRQEKVDLVFAPAVSEIYPEGFYTFVDVEHVTDTLEGAVRPGHFRGVATVVCKLFNIVQPTHAYFGQKDAQQTVVIRQMVRDLALPVEVVIVPTVREADGLAMSSRNAYLAPEERQAATVLYRALTTAQQAYQAGERNGAALRSVMQQVLAAEPLAHTEYVSVAHPTTLRALDEVGETGALLSMAVRIGATRLIDNVILP